MFFETIHLVMLGKKMNAAQRQKLQRSKLKRSKNQWKTKAMNRLDQLRLEKRKNRYLSKSRDRWKDRYFAEKTASQISAACPDEPLLYLMVVDTSQTQPVREKETAEITVAMEAWAQAFSADSPDHILPFYAEDTVLWGTLSTVRRDTPAAIRDYFVQVFTYTERKVTFADPLIRVYGDTAVNTGSSTFSWVRAGQAETIPTRYSMTYVKRKRRWLIIDHHSSVMPEPDAKEGT
jgi:uncharacterized protein (TIGR02246 family)